MGALWRRCPGHRGILHLRSRPRPPEDLADVPGLEDHSDSRRLPEEEDWERPGAGEPPGRGERHRDEPHRRGGGGYEVEEEEGRRYVQVLNPPNGLWPDMF